ncbi:MAG: DUF3801 domain-containing protein [Candidatus Pelethousia sp.]|nr:DUF3801 domain-containing protein [Candidatus Pelethousia sp.]
MSIGGDTADQLVKEGIEITESAVKLAGLGAKNLAALLLALLKDNKRLKGKTSICRLLHEDKPLSIFHVKKADISEFHRLAQKYGVLYTAIYNRTKDKGLCDVIVKAEDAVKVNRIMEMMEYPTPEQNPKNAVSRAPHDGKLSGRGNGWLQQTRQKMNEGKMARLEGLGAERLAALVLQVARENQQLKDASPLSRLFGEGKELQVVTVGIADTVTLQKKAAALDVPLSFHETGIPGQMQMIAQAEDAPLVNRLFAQMGQLPPMREGPQEQAAPTQTPAEKGKQPEKAREEKPSVRDKVQDAKAQRESKAPQEKARAPKAPKKSAPDKGR